MRPGPATAAFAEIAVLGFVVAGTLNAVVNMRAVARYLGGTIVLSNLVGPTMVRTMAAATATLGTTRTTRRGCEGLDGTPRDRMTSSGGSAGATRHGWRWKGGAPHEG
jgi:hypothetical protein